MNLEALKNRTSVQHARLERAVDIMNPAITRARYAALIADFHAFYAPLERAVFAREEWKTAGFDLAERQKVPLLARDLEMLGAKTPVTAPPAVRLEGFEAALGALYVMEGATLGGQVIGRHLEKHLGLTALSGAAFFNSYGERVGPMWMQFRAFLMNQAISPEAEGRVVDGALRTFEGFGDWLERATELR